MPFLLFFKISSPKIRVHGLFDGAKYSHIYGTSVLIKTTNGRRTEWHLPWTSDLASLGPQM